jgi:Glyoxalase/Bleomycin resistance protein/Dioxygenase superfamily
LSRHEVRWMFHSTAIVADYGLAIQHLGKLIGLRILEYGESSQPGIGRRGGMTWVGGNSIEIGQPITDGGAGRFVTDFGGGMHSVALQVRDLDGTIDHLESEGVRIAAKPTPEMCFSDPRDTGGVLIQWSSFELNEDPRFGAPEPEPYADATVPVSQHAFVGALAEEPVKLAHRLARLTGTDVAFENPGSASGEPKAGVSLGDCILALFDLSQNQNEGLWGHHYSRPRTHLAAMRVEERDGCLSALSDANISTVGTESGLILVDPSATAGIQIAFTDRLLTGDPRYQR